MIGYIPRKLKPVYNMAPYEKIVEQYCEKFGITKDDLRSKRKTGMPVRRVGEIRLDEMRRCLSYYFMYETFLTTKQIASLVGCRNHTSVLFQVTQADGHLMHKDEIFMSYYNVLESVVCN